MLKTQGWWSGELGKNSLRNRRLLNYLLVIIVVLLVLYTFWHPPQTIRSVTTGQPFVPGKDENFPEKLPGFAPGATPDKNLPTAADLEEETTANEDDESNKATDGSGPEYPMQSELAKKPEGDKRPESEKLAAPVLDKTQGGSFQKPSDTDYTATIVIGRLKKEEHDVRWALHELENVKPAIYLVDDPTSELHLEKNHGRESRVYLQYIMDNYDTLSDVTFFWHPDRRIWHNNILLGWDSVKMINSFSRAYVVKQGYAPARCDHWPGCPKWVTFNPTQHEHRSDTHLLADMFNDDLFHRLFPNSTVFPPYFAATCCSQFAVSRDAIRRNPISLYKNIADWIDEYWSDQASGRMMEVMWQYIFLGMGTMCPSMHECYCRTYGLCLEEDSWDIIALKFWDDFRLRFHQLNVERDLFKKKWKKDQKAFQKAGVKIEGKAEAQPEYKRIDNDWEKNKKLYNFWRGKLVDRWKLGKPPNSW